jgi:hypothetical protein
MPVVKFCGNPKCWTLNCEECVRLEHTALESDKVYQQLVAVALKKADQSARASGVKPGPGALVAVCIISRERMHSSKFVRFGLPIACTSVSAVHEYTIEYTIECAYDYNICGGCGTVHAYDGGHFFTTVDGLSIATPTHDGKTVLLKFSESDVPSIKLNPSVRTFVPR